MPILVAVKIRDLPDGGTGLSSFKIPIAGPDGNTYSLTLAELSTYISSLADSVARAAAAAAQTTANSALSLANSNNTLLGVLQTTVNNLQSTVNALVAGDVVFTDETTGQKWEIYFDNGLMKSRIIS